MWYDCLVMKFTLEKFGMSGFKLGSIGLESPKPVLTSPSSPDGPADWVRPSLGTTLKDALRPHHLGRKAELEARLQGVDRRDLIDANFNVEVSQGTIMGDIRWNLVASYFAVKEVASDYLALIDLIWEEPFSSTKPKEPSLMEDLFPDECLTLSDRKNHEAFFEVLRALR